MIVGAGHNGLVCAVRLAEAGVLVTVLERAPGIGGASHSQPATLPGFMHDICAGVLPLTAASPAFRRLNLELDWVHPEIPMAHPFIDGSGVALHREVGDTAASLEAVAPGSGRAWKEFIDPLWPSRELLIRAILARIPPLRTSARLALRLRGDLVPLSRRLLASTATFGMEVLKNERAAAWYSGSTAHSDLAPGAAGGAAFAFMLKLLGHTVGWPFPRGGVQAVPNALAERLTAAGGEIRTDAEVEELLVAGRRVKGVRLAGGETIAADNVVVTTTAFPFERMLPANAFPAPVRRSLTNWRYGLGTFKVDFALDGPTPWSSAEARAAGTVHVGDTLGDIFRSFHDSGYGLMPATPMLVVVQHSLHDATRAPEGKHTLYAYTRSPQRMPCSDDEAADVIEQRIEDFAPGFRKLVLARSIRNPQALEAGNAGLVGGDLGGGSYELDQQLVFRPHPRLARYSTPVAGLFMAGASNHPGGGMHGVQGDGAAAAVLRRTRRPVLN